MEMHLQEQTNSADYVCCLQHLQVSFYTYFLCSHLILSNISFLLNS